MYKARHAKPTRHRVTLPMLVLIAALCVAILIFPTTASGMDTTPDAISGSRLNLAQVSGNETYSVVPLRPARRQRDAHSFRRYSR